MEIKMEKMPLKAAIVCHGGNRISLTATNIRSVEFTFLREYLLNVLGRSEVDFVSRMTKKELDLDYFKDIFVTDLNYYDEIYIYNASYNVFGGIVPAENIELMKQLYNYNGKIWYFLGDPKMPYKDYAQYLKSKLKDGKMKVMGDLEFTGFTAEWLDSWSEKVYPKINIAFAGKNYDLYYNTYTNSIKDKNLKNKDYHMLKPDYDWFFLELFEYFAINEKLDLKLKDYDFNSKQYDLVYFGNDRQNERNKIIKKLYSNPNLKKICIGFDPELENCDVEKYIKHDELFPFIGEKCLATVVVGDILHNNNIKTPRFFESMLLDTVAFISTTYDTNKEFVTNEFLRDFIYVSDENELYDKINLIKNDEELYKKIVKLEREEILNQTNKYKQ
jgi:hypothetical protein